MTARLPCNLKPARGAKGGPTWQWWPLMQLPHNLIPGDDAARRRHHAGDRQVQAGMPGRNMRKHPKVYESFESASDLMICLELAQAWCPASLMGLLIRMVLFICSNFHLQKLLSGPDSATKQSLDVALSVFCKHNTGSVYAFLV